MYEIALQSSFTRPLVVHNIFVSCIVIQGQGLLSWGIQSLDARDQTKELQDFYREICSYSTTNVQPMSLFPISFLSWKSLASSLALVSMSYSIHLELPILFSSLRLFQLSSSKSPSNPNLFSVILWSKVHFSLICQTNYFTTGATHTTGISKEEAWNNHNHNSGGGDDVVHHVPHAVSMLQTYQLSKYLQPYEDDSIILSILQMRILKHRTTNLSKLWNQ